MRLLYFKGENFGDELNPLIFNQLIPAAFKSDSDNIDFIGIGSIIGLNRVVNARQKSKKIIFSSGASPAYMKAQSPFHLDDSYDILCVRGPKSAKLLNLDPALGITDGAALLRDLVIDRTVVKKFKYSFMPHIESDALYPWEKICNEAGVYYVSPSLHPTEVIDIILKTEIVIAEAMHFAIVADTLRVPWIPVSIYPQIDPFKWTDWAASLNMEYKPFTLKPLYERRENYGHVIESKLQNRFSIATPAFLSKPINRLSNIYQHKLVKQNIIKMMAVKGAEVNLSQEWIFNERVDQLIDRLEDFKLKYGF